MSRISESMFGKDDYNKSHFPNLLELSADLKTIFDQHIMSDLILSVNGKSIPCHKDILKVRSKSFHEMLSCVSFSGDRSINLNERDQILNAVLLYIYTGNLQLVESLNIPILDLLDAACRYGLSRLRKMLTMIIKSEGMSEEMKSIEFLWNIEYDGVCFRHDSWDLGDFSLHGTDKWCLQIRNLRHGNSKFIGIFVKRETQKETRRITHILNLKINIVNSSGMKLDFMAKEEIVSKDGEYNVSGLLPIWSLSKDTNTFFPGGMLIFDCEMTIWALHGNSELFQLKSNYRRYISNELLGLSRDMYKMLKTGTFFNNSIKVKGSDSMKVHSYILMARLGTPISRLNEMEATMGFGCMIWRPFVHFMYTGQTRYLDDHMRIFYYAFSKLRFTEAKQKYSKILAINLTLENAFCILCDATSYGDAFLTFSAARFLECNSCMTNHQMWMRLASSDTPNFVKEIFYKFAFRRTGTHNQTVSSVVKNQILPEM